MEVKIIQENNKNIAIVNSDKPLITDVQSSLDFMATIHYEYGCDNVIIDKEAISEEFFDLKTRMAGEILQKFVTYQMRIAIIGDFSVYSSKSLRDFIYESNKGQHIFFLSDERQAIDQLKRGNNGD
ncbi:MAG TPA: DUF4180 domain-containing protein [Clostridiales bacterium]|nr:DUF4180 domain-containing protein [Clostridiales bacterium]